LNEFSFNFFAKVETLTEVDVRWRNDIVQLHLYIKTWRKKKVESDLKLAM